MDGPGQPFKGQGQPLNVRPQQPRHQDQEDQQGRKQRADLAAVGPMLNHFRAVIGEAQYIGAEQLAQFALAWRSRKVAAPMGQIDGGPDVKLSA